MNKNTAKAKIVILGQDRVGKTSILKKYLEGRFSLDEPTTKQAYSSTTTIRIGNESLRLVIWDTAGQEVYHGLAPIYYRDSDGAIVVYDVTDRTSFERMQVWVKELRRQRGNTIKILVVGNKIDLEINRKVSKAEVDQYFASQSSLRHVYCSAKYSDDVKQVFHAIADLLLPSKQLPLEIKKASAGKVVIHNNDASVARFSEQLNEIVGKESWFWSKLDRILLTQHWQTIKWQDDTIHSVCKNGQCGREFGVFLWRHHCRNCGGIFCNACSSHRKPLPQIGYLTPVRVCLHCADAISSSVKSPRLSQLL